MKSLFKTVALITIFSVLTRIAGFIFRIILSREVGAEGLGIYQVAFSVFMVFLTIISSGLPLIISRLTAGYNAKKEGKKEGHLVSVAILYTLILSVVLCLIVLLCKGLFQSIFTDERCYQILVVLLPSLIFSSIYSVVRGAMWGNDNYFALCVSEFYEQIVRILLGVLVIGSSLSALENALNLGITMSIACFLSMIFAIFLFFYYGGKIKKLKKGYLKPLISKSTPITLMRVASSFIQPLIALIIPARLLSLGYTNSQAMSLYGVAMGMTLPLLFISTTLIGSLSTALVPDISKAVAQNDEKHISNRINKSISFALIISSLFVPLFLGMGESIGLFLYDDLLSGTLLQSASWVVIPLGLSNITSSLLNSLGYEKKSFINFIVGAVAMFIALWFLPELLGINSIIWAMGIDYTITSVLNLFLLKKKTKAEFSILPDLLKIIIVVIPSSALTSFVTSLLSYVFPLFINLVIGAIVAANSFVLLASALNLIDLKSIVYFAKSKVKIDKKVKSKKTKSAKT